MIPNSPGSSTGVQALAWTTTPWTLPTNAALAVGPAITYAVLPAGPNGIKAASADAPVTGSFLLAADLMGAYAKDLGYDDFEDAEAAVVSTHTGAELAGLEYQPLWDDFSDDRKVRHGERLALPRGGLRHHHGRHRHRPPGSRLR